MGAAVIALLLVGAKRLTGSQKVGACNFSALICLGKGVTLVATGVCAGRPLTQWQGNQHGAEGTPSGN